MEQYYYLITAVLYGIFVVRFILSWAGGDFDLDADLDLGDVVSFKGITHFLMGVFSWLSLKLYSTHCIMWYDYLIAFVIGLIFVGILFYIYKLMLKLESKPTILSGKDLIGHQGTIYLNEYVDLDTGMYHYTITVNNGGGTVELSAISSKNFRIGDSITITDFDNSYYLIK
jgi:hypothetical protein